MATPSEHTWPKDEAQLLFLHLVAQYNSAVAIFILSVIA